MTRVVVALTAVLALFFAAPMDGAHAQDQRPCVSKREFNGIDKWTKAELESRWEVVGLGEHVRVPMYGGAVLYPRCGFSMTKAWYGVSYQRRGRHLFVFGVVWWRDRGAKAHAPERTAVG